MCAWSYGIITLAWALCLSLCHDFRLRVCSVHTRISWDQTVTILRCSQFCWESGAERRRVIMEDSTVLIWLLSGPQRRRLMLLGETLRVERVQIDARTTGWCTQGRATWVVIGDDKCVGKGLFCCFFYFLCLWSMVINVFLCNGESHSLRLYSQTDTLRWKRRRRCSWCVSVVKV